VKEEVEGMVKTISFIKFKPASRHLTCDFSETLNGQIFKGMSVRAKLNPRGTAAHREVAITERARLLEELAESLERRLGEALQRISELEDENRNLQL
jgi:hypothetical protein